MTNEIGATAQAALFNWRSLLFVPANDRRRLATAHTRGADALILDLEDAVPREAKAQARAHLADAVVSLQELGQPVCVRINQGWQLAFEDLKAAVRSGVSALMVPKSECRSRLGALAEIVGELEEERALPQGAIGLVALVESPAGLAALPDLAAHPRVIGIALGSEDFAATMGVEPTPELLELPCRTIALAAATRGLMAIGYPASIAAFADAEGCARAAAAARAMGMTAGLCVHPRQVSVMNTAFSPSEAEQAAARRILAAWDDRGEAGVISLDGKMIDAPVVHQARRVLQRRADRATGER